MVEEQKEQPVDLEQLLNAEKKRSEEYLMRLKYLQADFENLKKRSDRQMEEVKSYCTERLVIQLLDVQDELEMALKTAQSANSAQPLIEGVQMTLKKLRKVLLQEGVSPIACEEGKAFDPSCHHAVAATERDLPAARYTVRPPPPPAQRAPSPHPQNAQIDPGARQAAFP